MAARKRGGGHEDERDGEEAALVLEVGGAEDQPEGQDGKGHDGDGAFGRRGSVRTVPQREARPAASPERDALHAEGVEHAVREERGGRRRADGAANGEQDGGGRAEEERRVGEAASAARGANLDA